MTPHYSLHMSTVFFSDFILQDVTVATFMIASSSWTKLKDSRTQTEQNEVSAIMIVKIIPQTVAIIAVLYLKKIYSTHLDVVFVIICSECNITQFITLNAKCV